MNLSTNPNYICIGTRTWIAYLSISLYLAYKLGMSRNLDWLKTINFLQAHYFLLFKKDKRKMNKTVDENKFMIDILEMPEITKMYSA